MGLDEQILTERLRLGLVDLPVGQLTLVLRDEHLHDLEQTSTQLIVDGLVGFAAHRRTTYQAACHADSLGRRHRP
jgi:hypothetical protein